MYLIVALRFVYLLELVNILIFFVKYLETTEFQSWFFHS